MKCFTSTCLPSARASSSAWAASTGGANCRAKVRSATFREDYPVGHEHLDAWTMTLNDVFGVFTSVNLDLAVRPRRPGGGVLPHRGQRWTFAGAREQMLAQTGRAGAPSSAG